MTDNNKDALDGIKAFIMDADMWGCDQLRAHVDGALACLETIRAALSRVKEDAPNAAQQEKRRACQRTG